MNGLFRAGLEMQDFLQNKQWRFCFIGGLAVLRWGEPRMTQDIDVSLLTGFGSEKDYIEDILSTFDSRISDPNNFAIRNRVLLIKASNGVAIDISLSGLPFESQMIKRSTPFDFDEGYSLITCSAEDLITLKAFANREIDWSVVKGIIIKMGKNLNFEYVFEQLVPLCEVKDDPNIISKLKNIIEQNT